MKSKSPSIGAPRVRAPVDVSFEFFPPVNMATRAQLWHALERLAPLGPQFVSVTYGADGSTRDRTHEFISDISSRTTVNGAPHLTCAGAPRSAVLELARRYRALGIRHIVALRGDCAAGAAYAPHPNGFVSTAALVSALRSLGFVDISVAAYPETHPEAASPAADIDTLRRKCEAGASRAITQFFFDVERFLRFRDACRRAGITVPLVPGVLPIGRFAQVSRFASRCGATIPTRIAARFEGLDNDPDTRQLISAAVSIELVEQLRAEGVDQFHFYTLNRAELTYAICYALGLRPATVTFAPTSTGY